MQTPAVIVVAPDSFKGSLAATRVAEAIKRGWHRARSDDDVTIMPMADGGEGTVRAFAAAVAGASEVPVRVTGPSGFAVDTTWVRLPPSDDAPGGTGVIEVASTSGIEMLDGSLRGWEASTIGFGQAIAAALDAGVSRLVLGIGSSASTDGGTGLLTALGARFTNDVETSVGPGASGLADITRIDLTKLRALPEGGVLVLSDVDAPLTGPRGAARVFGAQKGLDASEIATADEGLQRLGELMRAQVDVDPLAPGAGAAGGAGFGLLAWGATLTPGARHLADAVGLPALIEGADLVITGEGRFDAQTSGGKAPGLVISLARGAGVPVAVIAGRVDGEYTDIRTISLVEAAGSTEVAMADAERLIERAAADIAREFTPAGMP